jgi:hypothetical protein
MYDEPRVTASKPGSSLPAHGLRAEQIPTHSGTMLGNQPRPKGPGFVRTTWNTKLHHFPASTGALGRRSLHRQSRAIRTAFQNFRSVEVGMVRVTTFRTAEALAATRCRIDGVAGAAGLGAVRGGHFDQSTAAPGELVAQELDQSAPPGVGDAARERTVSPSLVETAHRNLEWAIARSPLLG